MNSIKGQAVAAKRLGVSRSVLVCKIQPIMLRLREAVKNPGKNGDTFFDPAALDRWVMFLATLDRRGGRGHVVDYGKYEEWRAGQ